MSRFRWGGIFLLAVGLVVGVASLVYAGGAKWTYPVQFGMEAGVPMAAGAMGNARNGSVTNANGDFIGCKVIGVAGGDPATNVVVWCVAQTAGGALSCTSTDAAIVKAAAAFASNSYVKFTVSDGNKCASLDVENFSGYLPATP